MESIGKTQQVVSEIQRRITSRSLQSGDKLPSIRGFAKSLSVAPSTVVDAFDRLVADGVIQAKRGSGFYVCETVRPFSVAEVGPRLDRAVDPFWVSRLSLDAGPELLKPGCGWLPPDWMPGEIVRRAVRKAARGDESALLDYGVTGGEPDVRHLLARQMQQDGIDVTPEQVLLTGSATQALDLVCRTLLRPGDTVMLDDPCYFNFQALLRAHQVDLIGAPYGDHGPEMGAFTELVERRAPKLYITNSVLQNPTGATLSASAAHQILTRAAAADMVIVEDDIFAELQPDAPARLAALDGLDRVIRVGGFSKTLSASIRCGTIAARRDWIEDMTNLQVATHFGGPSPFAVGVVRDVLSDGGYRKHVEKLIRRLAHARQDVADRLTEMGIEPVSLPRGGYYLWCRLPDGIDAAALAQRALARDILLAPGDVFSLSHRFSNHMRFNVGQMSEEVYDVLAEELSTMTEPRLIGG